jgi:hypothetical protein
MLCLDLLVATHAASLSRKALEGNRRLPFAGGGGALTGWETSERVLESGGFESRQRVLVTEPAVEASEAGARTLGLTYWQAVDRFTRGGIRATWTGDGGKLKLLGGPTLLTFGPAELSFEDGVVSCRHQIEGGLLALRAGGSVTLAQRPEDGRQELSVTVEGYLPRLAARAGAPPWTGIFYAKGQSPFHVAVSRCYFALLLRSRDA